MDIPGRPHLEVVPVLAGMVKVKATCDCGTVTEVPVDALELQDWARGKTYVQDLTGLNESQCEAILSGMCDLCWDLLMEFAQELTDGD